MYYPEHVKFLVFKHYLKEYNHLVQGSYAINIPAGTVFTGFITDTNDGLKYWWAPSEKNDLKPYVTEVRAGIHVSLENAIVYTPLNIIKLRLANLTSI